VSPCGGRASAAAFRGAARRRAPRGQAGFTLIEMLIVVAVIGILATMAVVQLRQTPQRAKEAALKENLYVLRNVIDQYFTDKGKYPESLQSLVDDGYIRKIPMDPMTQSDSTWVESQSGGPGTGGGADDKNDPSTQSGVADVHSGSDGTALDGTLYKDW
jgi:general secretion pathway protein G